MAELSRYQVLFAGRVQGVGFRATTWQIATRHAVAGFVRNLPDGRVELVAEGQPLAVERFLDDVRSDLGRYIRSEQIERLPPEGARTGFEIAH